MTFLAELKQNSNYPVCEKYDKKAWEGFRGQFLYRKEYLGEGRIKIKGHRIELQANMPDIQKEATLMHELGHARCAKRQCPCTRLYDRTTTELHAELYALHFLLKHRRKQALRFRIKVLHHHWTGPKYADALLKIKPRKIYARCEKFIGSQRPRYEKFIQCTLLHKLGVWIQDFFTVSS